MAALGEAGWQLVALGKTGWQALAAAMSLSFADVVTAFFSLFMLLFVLALALVFIRIVVDGRFSEIFLDDTLLGLLKDDAGEIA